MITVLIKHGVGRHVEFCKIVKSLLVGIFYLTIYVEAVNSIMFLSLINQILT